MHKLTMKDVEFEISITPEDVPPEDMMDFQDQIDHVHREMEWNDWAWCSVCVTATIEGFEGHAYLGGCSYENEEDFKVGGYYEQMQEEAFDDLLDEIDSAKTRIANIEGLEIDA